jgi:hypothetical protein
VNRNKEGRISWVSGDRKTIQIKSYRNAFEIGKESDWDNTTECYLYLIHYPLAGTVKCGDAAASFGIGCLANNITAYSHGYKCIADGKYSFVTGKENYGGWGTLVGGSGNDIRGIAATGSG